MFQSTRPRGARPSCGVVSSTPRKFQSTRPRGARPISLHSVLMPWAFQSTRPRGARPVPTVPPLFVPSFNPRAHAGRDLALLVVRLADSEFQSTRPRGARQRLSCRSPFQIVSIHAPTRGATVAQDVARVANMFQSTRPRGARPKPQVLIGCRVVFQSTRPRGARPAAPDLLSGTRRFQSTRPRGARLLSR